MRDALTLTLTLTLTLIPTPTLTLTLTLTLTRSATRRGRAEAAHEGGGTAVSAGRFAVLLMQTSAPPRQAEGEAGAPAGAPPRATLLPPPLALTNL